MAVYYDYHEDLEKRFDEVFKELNEYETISKKAVKEFYRPYVKELVESMRRIEHNLLKVSSNYNLVDDVYGIIKAIRTYAQVKLKFDPSLVYKDADKYEDIRLKVLKPEFDDQGRPIESRAIQSLREEVAGLKLYISKHIDGKKGEDDGNQPTP